MRVKLGRSENVSHSFYLDDTIQDAGDVIVSVTQASGQLVYTTTVSNVDNIYTFTLPAQSDLGQLTVHWVGTLTDTTNLDVVGDHLIELADLNAYMASKGYKASADVNLKKYMRDVCADAFDSIIRSTFTLRRKSESVSFHGQTGVISDTGVVQVLTDNGASFTGACTPYGVVTMTAGYGDSTHELAYDVVHPRCTDGVPDDVRQAALEYTTSLLGYRQSNVPDTAETVSLDNMTYRPVVAGTGSSFTGIPRVDSVLKRYRINAGVY